MPPKVFKASSSLRIGVLLAPPPVQLLDFAPIDLFFMASKDYMDDIPMLPSPVKKLAIDKIDIVYISDEYDPAVQSFTTTSNEQIRLAPLTAKLNIRLTANLSTPEVQPGELTVLMIPGPEPASIPSQKYKDFLKAHASSGLTDIITICTGIYPACHSGICDGKTITGPRGLLPDLKSKFKEVKMFEDYRWSRDVLRPGKESGLSGDRPAELWTAAGITNGNDTISAYLREHFNPELAEIVCRMADVGDRPRTYDTGQVTENMWWLSRILKAAMKSLWKI